MDLVGRRKRSVAESIAGDVLHGPVGALVWRIATRTLANYFETLSGPVNRQMSAEKPEVSIAMQAVPQPSGVPGESISLALWVEWARHRAYAEPNYSGFTRP